MKPYRSPTRRAWPTTETEDMAGQKHGLVTVLRRAQSVGFGTRWLVQCECGHQRYLRRGEVLKAPRTHRSCVAREAAE